MFTSPTRSTSAPSALQRFAPRAAIVAVVLLLAGLPASAASAAVPDENDAETHCAVEVAPIGEAPATSAPVCFDTEAEAVAFIDSLQHSARAGTSAASAAASLTLLGTVYSNINGGGSSYTFFGSSGCSGVTFGFATLAAGWSTIISSARSETGCWMTLYSTANYGGSRLNCTPWCASVYDMNDKVKSIVFRQTGQYGRAI